MNPTDALVDKATEATLKSQPRLRSIDPGAIGLFTQTPRRDWSFNESLRTRPHKPRAERTQHTSPKLVEAQTRCAEALSALLELLK